LVDGLDATCGGQLLYQLADGYRQAGRLDLAADAFFLLARRFPDHPLADSALTWLVQFYASSETAGRSLQNEATNMRQPQPTHTTRDESPNPESRVKQTSAVATMVADTPPAIGLSPDDRMRRAVQLGEYLESARPLLFADPAIRFPLVAAQRQLGFANPAKRYFLTLGQLPENDPWRRCAQTEQWLAKPTDSPPPKALAHCRIAADRPDLDGQLDEPFWQSADVIRLRSRDALATETPPPRQRAQIEKASSFAEVRLAHDTQYLYVAIHCPKAEGGDYQPDAGPRPRDSDLTHHDRVALRLDLDRDFTSWFELTVDHRGWTRDECWSGGHWDPSWYVAAAEEPGYWDIEAAVPLAELVAQPPAANDVWAIALRRTIPRVGFESWTGDFSDTDSPDEFGILIFE
jgi:hypothetical protein